MAFLRFFRVPRHQKYEYKPRYWDPKKEELQERLNRIKEMKKGGVEATKSRISGGFKRGYAAHGKSRSSHVLKSNLVLLGIVVVLLMLSYLFITKYLPKIAASLEGSGQM